MNIEDYADHSPQYYGMELPVWLFRSFVQYCFLRESSADDISVLDIGCGDGSLINSLIKENICPPVLQLNAIDLSQKRIDIVKKNFPTVNARVDSAETLDTVKDGSIDFAISMMVIEHVADFKFIRTLFRVLKPKGTAYITTIYKKPWAKWFYRNSNGESVLDPTHIWEYDEDDAKHLLIYMKQEGFSIIHDKKIPLWYSIIDPIIKLFKIKDRRFTDNKLMQLLKKIKIPVPGYYEWEIVLKKEVNSL